MLGGGAAALAIPSAAQATLSRDIQKFELEDEKFEYEDEGQHWLREIERYAMKVHARYGEHGKPAISVPFATFPCNTYVRNPAIDPEPDITNVRMMVEMDDDAGELALKWLLRRYMLPRLKAVLPLAKYVGGIKRPRPDKVQAARDRGEVVMLPDRITTPKYVIDIAELTNGPLAMMIIRAGDGIVEVMTERVKTARHCYATGEYSLVPGDEYLEHSLPMVSAKRDAYMFEMFAWIEARGVITPMGRRLAHPGDLI